jgi:cytochrome c biogenesis protein CcdA/glutaredoxin
MMATLPSGKMEIRAISDADASERIDLHLRRLSSTLILFLLLSSFFVLASGEIDIVYFYESGCPHCLRIEAFLDRMEKAYEGLVIHSYGIHSEGNITLLQRLEALYDITVEELPVIFIDDEAFQGTGRAVEFAIEQAISTKIGTGAISPLVRLKRSGEASKKSTHTLTIPALLAAAVVDAVNPCACAVLILLLGTLIVAGKRQKMIAAGLAFTLATYISYFLMGIGLYSAIQAARLQRAIYLVVASLAILIGLWNMKDYLWYGRWFTIEVPAAWRPALKRITSSVSSPPGAFAIGFLVSLFLLPCTSGPYIVILGLLAETTTRNSAALLLLLYNFIFVLLFIIITLGVAFGFTTTARAEHWRQERLGKLHLVTGIVMVLLGLGMFMSKLLGHI